MTSTTTLPAEALPAADLKDRDVAVYETEHNTGVLEIDDDDHDRPIRTTRKRDFGFLPIPKSKRHDPSLKVHEQFAFTWRMNLTLAGAAVGRAQK